MNPQGEHSNFGPSLFVVDLFVWSYEQISYFDIWN